MEIKLPKLGEGAESGVVVAVLVKPGDSLQKGQTIIELENEKAVAPIPSPESGVVEKVVVKEGDTINSGQVVLILGSSAGASSSGVTKVETPRASNGVVQVSSNSAPAQVSKQVLQPQISSGNFQYKSASGFPPPTTPTIRKIAEQIGLDLTRIPGSGPGGRIEFADVRNYLSSLQHLSSLEHQSVLKQGAVDQTQTSSINQPTAAEQIDFSKWGDVRREKLSSLRNVIGRRMLESWNSIPHVTQFDEADITSLMEIRKKYKDSFAKDGAQLTVTIFILSALVQALKAYPIFNSSLDEVSGELVYKNYISLGVAVDTENGLIVPVLRDVDKKSMRELSKELKTLAEKTRERKVTGEELKGGSFTVSNLGGIGGTFFTPIINRPEVAILGVGKGVEKVVSRSNKIVSSLMLPLALSYDHRVIDGADAARFISMLVSNLESFDESKLV